MQPPPDLAERARSWDDLHRWERAELGRALRGLGWTYSEIMEVIPVPKGTLSYGCREITLTDEQVEAIKARVPFAERRAEGLTVARTTRDRTDRQGRRSVAMGRLQDPFSVAGTVLYWAEGSKSKRALEMANADPAALMLFITWVRRYDQSDAAFTLAMHLHEGNDEQAA